ncbi:type II toxin-antitoxin system HicA family toxin [Pleurocapsales cyanobacterium LEGE 06147]|nr:type II toxin-antitoxin system HicA family toxin [Pleurocapsales cyanobacterium LEGE 06147]
MKLSKKHQKTLVKLFEQPVRSNIAWTELESLLAALGAEISEGRGSRVRIALNGVRAVFHRPHPQKETDKGAVMSMRRFLTEAGVKEDEV